MNGLDPTFARAIGSLVAAARAAGYRVAYVSGYRSDAHQRQLYQDCQRRRCPYPVARPGTSMHARRVAVDLHVEPEKGYRVLGEAWERMGGTWGGRFRDRVHFDARVLLGGR